MNTLLRAIYFCGLALLPGLRAQTPDPAETTFRGHLEKVDFDGQSELESLLTDYLNRLNGVSAGAQRGGDLVTLLACREEVARVKARRGPPETPIAAPATLVAPAKVFAERHASSAARHARARAALVGNYRSYLDSQMKAKTKAGAFAEAEELLKRIQALDQEQAAPPSSPAPNPAPPGEEPAPSPSPAPVEWSLPRGRTPPLTVERFRELGLALHRRSSAWKVREESELVMTVVEEGVIQLGMPRHPDSHHKLALGRQPLRVGDEWIIDAKGLYNFEVALMENIADVLAYNAGDRDIYQEYRVRRTSQGVEVEIDGKRAGSTKYGLPGKDIELFHTKDLAVCLGLMEKYKACVRRVEFRPGDSKGKRKP